MNNAVVPTTKKHLSVSSKHLQNTDGGVLRENARSYCLLQLMVTWLKLCTWFPLFLWLDLWNRKITLVGNRESPPKKLAQMQLLQTKANRQALKISKCFCLRYIMFYLYLSSISTHELLVSQVRKEEHGWLPATIFLEGWKGGPKGSCGFQVWMEVEVMIHNLHFHMGVSKN